MPIRMKRVCNGEGMLLLMSGVLTGREAIEFMKLEIAEPDLLAGRRWVLADLTEVERLDVEPNEIRRIATLGGAVSKITGRNIVAIVATQDSLFGMGRMWEAHLSTGNEDWVTMIHRTRPEAEDWLRQQVEEAFGAGLSLGGSRF